ncbi:MULTISPECIES: hypothetical protein [Winogradskyella]|uniref:hypothetical protein n=1 Tax=Winogradskyella TaxID=286104 RepID=UPI0015CAB02C|nr:MULTISPECIES: hypothetical protein [Winogradskyella]QXP78042.1 hypothetical protein H0I32_12535 [Winogradskyella sp. HaHa_3_26]
MRLIQTFFDAINRIVNSIDNDDIEGAKIQLNNSYGLLGNKEDYFLNTEYEELIKFFKLKDGNYLKRVEFLAELIYLDATIESKKNRKIEKLEKSQQLFQHCVDYSNEYSFEINNKLILINNELEKIE